MWYVFGKPLFLLLTISLCLVQYLDHLVPRVFRLGPRCGLPVLYSSSMCTHAKPAPPTPSTASTLPCKTHPSQRLSIILMWNPTEREPLHYTSVGFIEVVWTRGRRLGDCCVCVFVCWGFWNRRKAELQGRRATRSPTCFFVSKLLISDMGLHRLDGGSTLRLPPRAVKLFSLLPALFLAADGLPSPCPGAERALSLSSTIDRVHPRSFYPPRRRARGRVGGAELSWQINVEEVVLRLIGTCCEKS